MSYIALKGFLNGDEYQKRGRPIDVSGERARELQRLGLIAPTGEKAAPAPQNKMNPAPINKAAGNEATTPTVDHSELLGKNAPDVAAAIAEIGDIEVLRSVLAAEEAGKARKSVIEAIQAGIAARSV